MSRRDQDDMLPPAVERDIGDVIPGTVLPSDAEDLTVVIDRRFKALLSLATEPKDLTAALVAATKWWEVAHGQADREQWGSKLGRTTRDG